MLDAVNAENPPRRPRLLLQAARCGLPAYRRDRDLARILRKAARAAAAGAGQAAEPAPELGAVRPPEATDAPAPDALAALVAFEAACETHRRAGLAGYSAARHVEVLIALLAEAGAR